MRPPNLGKRSVSRRRGFRQNAHFALVGRFGAHPADQIFSRFSGSFQGVAKKQGKNRVFLVVSCACFFCFFFFFYFVSSWSPVILIYLLACKCVIHPCFLTFVVMFSFFPVVVFPCFYSSLFLLCSSLFI